MKIDLTAKVHERAGERNCEYAGPLGICDGPIKGCLYAGLCKSKLSYGRGYFCIFELQKAERKSAGADVDSATIGFKPLIRKLA